MGPPDISKSAKRQQHFQNKAVKNEPKHDVSALIMAPSEFSGEKADHTEWESDVTALHKTFKLKVKKEVIFFTFCSNKTWICGLF